MKQLQFAKNYGGGVKNIRPVKVQPLFWEQRLESQYEHWDKAAQLQSRTKEIKNG